MSTFQGLAGLGGCGVESKTWRGWRISRRLHTLRVGSEGLTACDIPNHPLSLSPSLLLFCFLQVSLKCNSPLRSSGLRTRRQGRHQQGACTHSPNRPSRSCFLLGAKPN